jgi:hypothetical protein
MDNNIPVLQSNCTTISGTVRYGTVSLTRALGDDDEISRSLFSLDV